MPADQNPADSMATWRQHRTPAVERELRNELHDARRLIASQRAALDEMAAAAEYVIAGWRYPNGQIYAPEIRRLDRARETAIGLVAFESQLTDLADARRARHRESAKS